MTEPRPESAGLPDPWLIPHDSLFKTVWNIATLVVVLVFTFLVTYRLVFREDYASWLYYAMNAFFVADIFVCLQSRVKIGYLRLDTRQQIRSHYLKSWFVIDFMAAFPFEFIPLLLFGSLTDHPELFPLYLALQALTLAKSLKAVRVFRELQEALGIMPAIKRLVQFGYWFVQALHLMALGWVLIGAGDTARNAMDQYLRALYWVTTTIATIGYGDYYPNHDSNLQIGFTIMVQLFGVGMYTYAIANVSSLVSNLDVARASYQRKLEEVNSWLKSQKIPVHLQEQVRDYFSYVWTRHRSVNPRSTLEELPGNLSLEILMYLNRDLLTKVPLFKDAQELFIRESVQLLKPRIFMPNEYIIRQGENGDSMYFLTSGDVDVLVDDTVVARLGAGSFFGEAALVTGVRRNASVRAMSYSTGYQLARSDFDDLRQRYPEFDVEIRRVAETRHK